MSSETVNQMRTDTNTLLAEVLARIASSGQLQEKDRRWLTERLNDAMAHERNMKILELLVTDDDAFYKVLFLGGAAASVLGAALGIVDTAVPSDVFPDGLAVAGLPLFVGGITTQVFAGIMLAIPRTFGDDGIQFTLEAGGFGYSGKTTVG